MIRSGFEPETHSLEGCCSIQLSYQTSSECACRMNDALSASLGRPRFLLLTQTHEVWVSSRPLVAWISLAAFKEHALVTFFNVYTRKTTRVGTLIGAYKGNLGAKVLLFFDLCKCFCKKVQNYYKSSSKSFCKSGLRMAPT